MLDHFVPSLRLHYSLLVVHTYFTVVLSEIILTQRLSSLLRRLQVPARLDPTDATGVNALREDAIIERASSITPTARLSVRKRSWL